MMLSCSLAKSSFASEFSWFCPGEAIKCVLFKCLCFIMSFFSGFFFFQCEESHKVNDPKAELCLRGAKDGVFAPSNTRSPCTSGFALMCAISPWGCWATADPELGTFCRHLGGLAVMQKLHLSALGELPLNTQGLKGIKKADSYYCVGNAQAKSYCCLGRLCAL